LEGYFYGVTGLFRWNVARNFYRTDFFYVID